LTWAGRTIVGLLLAISPTLASCGPVVTNDERAWAESTNSPAQFAAWKGSVGIDLPASRDDFIRYVTKLGASYYVTGEGEAKALSVPPPLSGSPCLAGVRAIVIDFPVEARAVTPRYVAYLDANGLVRCIDKQFAYLGP